jgi:hypothetical protein
MVTGFTYFASQSFGGNIFIGFGQFLIIEGQGFFAIPSHKVGRFHISPSQILVAILAVVFSFLLIVGLTLTLNAAAIGSIVTIISKKNVGGAFKSSNFSFSIFCTPLTHRYRKKGIRRIFLPSEDVFNLLPVNVLKIDLNKKS